jgi:hypothetical protein
VEYNGGLYKIPKNKKESSMRKNILILWVLTLSFFALRICSATDSPQSIASVSDTIITLHNDNGIKQYSLHKGDGYITMKSLSDKPTDPINSMILDVPANDSCSNAAIINDFDSLAFDATEATFDGPGDVIITPDIWYKYTATTTGPVRIQVDNFPQGTFPMLAVYDGWDCPQYTPLPAIVTRNGGETIDNAVALPTTLPARYTGTLQSHSPDIDLPCVQQNSYEDVVYAYTSPVADTINISLCPTDTAGWSPVLAIIDTAGNVLTCSNDFNWAQTFIFNLPVAANERYYIVVSASNFTAIQPHFILSLSSPAYRLISYPQYSISTLAARLDFNVIAGHQYLIELGDRTRGNFHFYLTTGFISIKPAPAPPVNDNCENATDGGILTPGNTLSYTGNNIGATIDCQPLVDFPEVWVKFTTEETLDVRIDYCGTSAITNLISVVTRLSNSCPCGPTCGVEGEIDRACPFNMCPNLNLNIAWYGLPPGTYLFPMVVLPEFEGPYQINITGAKKQFCDTATIYGQRPSAFIDGEMVFFLESDMQNSDAGADIFTIPSSYDITRLSWWGANTNPLGMEACPNIDSYSFNVSFCNAGDSFPQDTVASYNVNLVPEYTGYFLASSSQMKFVFDLPTPLHLTHGWVIVQADSATACLFMWQSTPDGASALQYSNSEQNWHQVGFSTAFCLYGQEAPPPACSYMPGDINGDDQRIGGDVTYGVRYFKGTGGVPPDSCYMDSTSAYLYVSGDVNGNCEFRGSDITRLVAFFKGSAQLSNCHFFPPPILRNDKAISPKLSGEN